MTEKQKKEIVIAGLLIALLVFILWLLLHKRPSVSANNKNSLPVAGAAPLPFNISPLLIDISTPNAQQGDQSNPVTLMLPAPTFSAMPRMETPCGCHAGCNKQTITLNTDAAQISNQANSALAQIVAMGNTLVEYLNSIRQPKTPYTLITAT